MRYTEALQYMQGLRRFGIKLGNERIEALMEALGNPHHRYRIIHVAGTKGKGSTTAYAAAMLVRQGYAVGGYFSPYVYDVRERVQINGTPISRAEFARHVTRIRPLAEALAKTSLGPTTEFELKTAVAFCAFADHAVQIACVEVGIGGRLDATNIVRPDVSVITNIGLDHMDRLGDTHAAIAAEKAGIIKPGVPCITAAEHPDALRVIERAAEASGSALLHVRRKTAMPDAEIVWSPVGPGGDMQDSAAADEWGRASIRTRRADYTDLRFAMGGSYQRCNAACAAGAVEEVCELLGEPLNLESVRSACSDTEIPGRLVQVSAPGCPLVILDGAHNGMSAVALAAAVRPIASARPGRRVHLVFGMLSGHDPATVLEPLSEITQRVHLCAPNWNRAIPVETLRPVAATFFDEARAYASVRRAIGAAIRGAADVDIVLVTGSFYVVGEAPPEWVRRRLTERMS